MADESSRGNDFGPEAERRWLSRLTGGLRSRLLVSYVVLLLLAGSVSVLAARQVLLVRLDDRVEADLQQEVEEFRALASNGVDPVTGEPFRNDVHALFRTYRQRNVPDDDEELITVPRRGAPQRLGGDNTVGFTFADFVADWRRLESVDRGEIDTPVGEARYIAAPVSGPGREPLGTFVVSIFMKDELEQVNQAVGVIAIVTCVVMLLGSVIGFSIVGRVLAPIRKLRDAARSVSGTRLDQRIEVKSNDEVAELARTFNGMMDRLEVAFASQREFIRDVSHELRTPSAGTWSSLRRGMSPRNRRVGRRLRWSRASSSGRAGSWTSSYCSRRRRVLGSCDSRRCRSTGLPRSCWRRRGRRRTGLGSSTGARPGRWSRTISG